MCTASRAWPSRLHAAAMALALMVACVVGAHAHAKGHQAHHAGAAPVETLSEAIAGGPVAAAYDHSSCAQGGSHDCEQPEQAPDCCDTTCHCGHAILAAVAVVPHPRLSAPAIEPVAAPGGVESAGLDRPPKAYPSS